jgi:hypothetical protein
MFCIPLCSARARINFFTRVIGVGGILIISISDFFSRAV